MKLLLLILSFVVATMAGLDGSRTPLTSDSTNQNSDFPLGPGPVSKRPKTKQNSPDSATDMQLDRDFIQKLYTLRVYIGYRQISSQKKNAVAATPTLLQTKVYRLVGMYRAVVMIM
ncbi:hypothetical protein RRG08_043347 [Elysia crispata]|uniref:Uncharacterized protein n=1 Tax=Elysia crispata TaxID=231223 RepID=A0AAE1BCI9_9GAST|nr:hypothetical protein RRG08_043347 [Elysia crispata]